MMRIINLFLVTLLFFPLVSTADERQFNETIKIMSTSDFSLYDDAATGCEWAVPHVDFDLIGGATFNLLPVAIDADSGTMISGADETDGPSIASFASASPASDEEGSSTMMMWMCIGEEIEVDGSIGSRYENPVAFAFIMGDKVYGALGTLVTTGYLGFPEESSSTLGISATVVEVTNDVVGEVVGGVTMNMLQNWSGVEGYSGEGFSMVVTLRLYSARDLDAENASGELRF